MVWVGPRCTIVYLLYNSYSLGKTTFVCLGNRSVGVTDVLCDLWDRIDNAYDIFTTYRQTVGFAQLSVDTINIEHRLEACFARLPGPKNHIIKTVWIRHLFSYRLWSSISSTAVIIILPIIVNFDNELDGQEWTKFQMCMQKSSFKMNITYQRTNSKSHEQKRNFRPKDFKPVDFTKISSRSLFLSATKEMHW